ncbi:MAG: sigma-70 family RNA polymerase sigma factor [Prolixibacteraceae bacterium]
MTLTAGGENKEYWHMVWLRFKDGDKEAFAILYNLHINRLYQYGLKFSNDEGTIKDAVQEVFVDLYLKRQKNKSTPENLKYYLLLALKRNLIKKLKSGRRFDRSEITDGGLADREFSPEYQIIEIEQDDELRNKVVDALSHLPGKQKEAIYLRFNEALDYPEIALIMGITIESVRKQVYRALKTVRGLLDIKSIMILFHLFQIKQKKLSMFK